MWLFGVLFDHFSCLVGNLVCAILLLGRRNKRGTPSEKERRKEKGGIGEGRKEGMGMKMEKGKKR
jgi:hypothetical protein